MKQEHATLNCFSISWFTEMWETKRKKTTWLKFFVSLKFSFATDEYFSDE